MNVFRNKNLLSTVAGVTNAQFHECTEYGDLWLLMAPIVVLAAMTIIAVTDYGHACDMEKDCKKLTTDKKSINNLFTMSKVGNL